MWSSGSAVAVDEWGEITFGALRCCDFGAVLGVRDGTTVGCGKRKMTVGCAGGTWCCNAGALMTAGVGGIGGLIVIAVVTAAAEVRAGDGDALKIEVDGAVEGFGMPTYADDVGCAGGTRCRDVGDGSRIAIGDATSTGVDVGVRCSGAAENPAVCSWRVHASTSAAVSPRTSNATLAVADVFNACS